MGKATEFTNSLTVRDNRTGKTYNVPYVQEIQAGFLITLGKGPR